jgi:hypothetical protein
LQEVQGDGATLRQHLIALERATKKPHEHLTGRKPLKDSAKYLWQWFVELRREAGGSAITAKVMQDWQWLTGNRLNMYERRIIGAIDHHWRHAP